MKSATPLLIGADRHRIMDMNILQTAVTPDHAAAGQDANRLPWTAPVLGVYDVARLTLGSSDQSSDGFINTHS